MKYFSLVIWSYWFRAPTDDTYIKRWTETGHYGRWILQSTKFLLSLLFASVTFLLLITIIILVRHSYYIISHIRLYSLIESRFSTLVYSYLFVFTMIIAASSMHVIRGRDPSLQRSSWPLKFHVTLVKEFFLAARVCISHFMYSTCRLNISGKLVKCWNFRRSSPSHYAWLQEKRLQGYCLHALSIAITAYWINKINETLIHLYICRYCCIIPGHRYH